jgi:hypothetical protein
MQSSAMAQLRVTLIASTLILGYGTANATAIDYSGGAVTWTAPSSGVYEILAYGANGGGSYGEGGGSGAEIGGSFLLTAGEALGITVGGVGENGGYCCGAGGGGGGSFVLGPAPRRS